MPAGILEVHAAAAVIAVDLAGPAAPRIRQPRYIDERPAEATDRALAAIGEAGKETTHA